MGVGVSLILIAAGAVLAWAVDVSTSGFNVNTVGYILLIVGIIGVLLSTDLLVELGRPGLLHTNGSHHRRRVTSSEDL